MKNKMNVCCSAFRVRRSPWAKAGRRRVSLALALVLSALSLSASADATSGDLSFAASEAPLDELFSNPLNVVIVYIDDMGWKDLSCYGSTFYETPVIDQLATNGVRFTDAYAACQICAPSRRALLTGKYPSRSKFTDLPNRPAATGEKLIDPVQGDIMPNSEVLFPEIFQAAGYRTMFIGKWGL